MRITYCLSAILILTVSIVAVSCLSSTQKDAKDLIPAELLQNDFQVLRSTLEESHPGLYWYNSKKDLDAFFDSIYHSIDHPMTEETFARILLPAIAQIKCIHTGARVSEKAEQDIVAEARLLPINIDFAEGNVFISGAVDKASTIPMVIKTINGIAIDTILNKLLPLIPSDGFNITYKYHILRAGFFREGYALLYGQPGEFIIEGVDSLQQKRKIALFPKTPVELNAAFTQNRVALRSEFLRDDSIGLLSISTFEVASTLFHEQVETFFAALKKRNCHKLIIDVRGNGGGNNANVTKLFSYLACEPFLHLKKTEVKTKDGIIAVDNDYPGRKWQPVADNAFGGELIVLADGGTVSAASEFTALVRGYQRGLIVGEETGGCFYGATGGRYIQLELPASKIRVRIPTVRIFTAVAEDFNKQPPGRGVMSDYGIPRRMADILNNKDAGLDTACRLLSVSTTKDLASGKLRSCIK